MVYVNPMVKTEAENGKRELAINPDTVPYTFDGLYATVTGLTGTEQPIPPEIVASMSLKEYTWTRIRNPAEACIKPDESNLTREIRGELIEGEDYQVATIQITPPLPRIFLNASGQRIGQKYRGVTIIGLNNNGNVVCAAFNPLTNKWTQTTILPSEPEGLVF